MQHVLVHIDADLGPVGAWSFRDGELRHFYPDSLDPVIPERARLLMARRDDDISVTDWFAHLADCTADAHDELARFELTIEGDHVVLVDILAEFRRHWNPV